MEHDICIVEEQVNGQPGRCSNYAIARGYCQTHYKRWKRYGDPTYRKRVQAYSGQTCRYVEAGTGEKCQRLARKDGWCKMHYDRTLQKGDPGPLRALRARNRAVGRVRSSGGYIQVYDSVRKRYVMEHRLVMEREKGRELYPFENVHHKNGDKQDNRPGNLEIWLTHQPPGQRPEDVAVWMWTHYPEVVVAIGRVIKRERKSGQLRLVN